MILVVCSVRDSAAQSFMNPIFAHNRGSAMRSFRDEVNRSADDNIMNKHPSDFELFFLGEYDSDTGSFKLVERPESMLRGVDCKEI